MFSDSSDSLLRSTFSLPLPPSLSLPRALSESERVSFFAPQFPDRIDLCFQSVCMSENVNDRDRELFEPYSSSIEANSESVDPVAATSRMRSGTDSSSAVLVVPPPASSPPIGEPQPAPAAGAPASAPRSPMTNEPTTPASAAVSESANVSINQMFGGDASVADALVEKELRKLTAQRDPTSSGPYRSSSEDNIYSIIAAIYKNIKLLETRFSHSAFFIHQYASSRIVRGLETADLAKDSEWMHLQALVSGYFKRRYSRSSSRSRSSNTISEAGYDIDDMNGQLRSRAQQPQMRLSSNYNDSKTDIAIESDVTNPIMKDDVPIELKSPKLIINGSGPQPSASTARSKAVVEDSEDPTDVDIPKQYFSTHHVSAASNSISKCETLVEAFKRFYKDLHSSTKYVESLKSFIRGVSNQLICESSDYERVLVPVWLLDDAIAKVECPNLAFVELPVSAAAKSPKEPRLVCIACIAMSGQVQKVIRDFKLKYPTLKGQSKKSILRGTVCESQFDAGIGRGKISQMWMDGGFPLIVKRALPGGQLNPECGNKNLWPCVALLTRRTVESHSQSKCHSAAVKFFLNDGQRWDEEKLEKFCSECIVSTTNAAEMVRQIDDQNNAARKHLDPEEVEAVQLSGDELDDGNAHTHPLASSSPDPEKCNNGDGSGSAHASSVPTDPEPSTQRALSALQSGESTSAGRYQVQLQDSNSAIGNCNTITAVAIAPDSDDDDAPILAAAVAAASANAHSIVSTKQLIGGSSTRKQRGKVRTAQPEMSSSHIRKSKRPRKSKEVNENSASENMDEAPLTAVLANLKKSKAASAAGKATKATNDSAPKSTGSSYSTRARAIAIVDSAAASSSRNISQTAAASAEVLPISSSTASTNIASAHAAAADLPPAAAATTEIRRSGRIVSPSKASPSGARLSAYARAYSSAGLSYATFFKAGIQPNAATIDGIKASGLMKIPNDSLPDPKNFVYRHNYGIWPDSELNKYWNAIGDVLARFNETALFAHCIPAIPRCAGLPNPASSLISMIMNLPAVYQRFLKSLDNINQLNQGSKLHGKPLKINSASDSEMHFPAVDVNQDFGKATETLNILRAAIERERKIQTLGVIELAERGHYEAIPKLANRCIVSIDRFVKQLGYP
jgi:hypothetical protein